LPPAQIEMYRDFIDILAPGSTAILGVFAGCE
jgi:hypothetical protein